VAPVIGLDYLSISQAGAIGDADFVSNAQLEAGRYLGDDVFVVLVFSTPTDQAAGDEGGVSFLRGVRVEWALSDEYFLEGFVEDLFLRSGTAGLGAAGLDGVQVVGMYLFREWGYGSQQ